MVKKIALALNSVNILNENFLSSDFFIKFSNSRTANLYTRLTTLRNLLRSSAIF